MRRLVHCQKPILLALLVFYIGLVLFSLFNYRSHCMYTSPESLITTNILDPAEAARICPVNFDQLGVVNLDIHSNPSFEFIQRRNPHVQLGGQWRPTECKSFQKIAVIIPYRDRLYHLRIMLNRIHPLLWKQNIDYQVFLIEQIGNDRFNRGKLMNVGFNEALKVSTFDCFIFHDVDLLPENDKNLYMCDSHLRQLSSAIDETRYHVMYYNYAGGVIAMKADSFRKINGYANSYWGWGNEDDDISARVMYYNYAGGVIAMKADSFRKINGYANSYWGWGNEDDDISARTQESGLLITRPPEHIGRFKMVRHAKETRSENGYEAFFGWKGRWMNDGLNTPFTMNYTVVKATELPLYTNITVDIGPSKGHRIDTAKDTTHESLWWFLKFYFP